jgi:hypothetical protein
MKQFLSTAWDATRIIFIVLVAIAYFLCWPWIEHLRTR